MMPLNDLTSFVAVAETSGFASAAKRLSVSKAGVSKSITRLEERLSVRLFTRTTRQIALTPEGQRFYRRCRAILDELQEAERDVADMAGALSGRICIDMPSIFGECHVLPILADFKQQHPGIELDIRLSDNFTDLIQEGIDLAVRFGELTDSRLVGRVLKKPVLVTCATPDYFTKHGMPQTIEDLDRHSCIGFKFRSTGRAFIWRFESAGEAIGFMPKAGISVNDSAAYRQMALLGSGIIQDLDVNLQASIADGRLLTCLPQNQVSAFPINLVWPAGRYQPIRVRELINALISKLI